MDPCATKTGEETLGRSLVGLGNAVEADGHEEEGEAGGGAAGDILTGERLEHETAEATRTHDGGDAEHRDRKQQGLVDAGHDRGSGQRDLDVGEHAVLGCAIGP